MHHPGTFVKSLTLMNVFNRVRAGLGSPGFSEESFEEIRRYVLCLDIGTPNNSEATTSKGRRRDM